jgi:hypothetical protein
MAGTMATTTTTGPFVSFSFTCIGTYFFYLPSTASTYENILDAAETLRNWDFAREENVWEQSGLLEGDIMVLPKRNELRNVVLSDYYNWPNATIPYVLQEGMSKLSAKLFRFKDLKMNKANDQLEFKMLK